MSKKLAECCHVPDPIRDYGVVCLGPIAGVEVPVIEGQEQKHTQLEQEPNEGQEVWRHPHGIDLWENRIRKKKRAIPVSRTLHTDIFFATSGAHFKN